MNTRNKTRKREAQTRMPQDIIAVGQVIILKRPGVPQDEPTPSTSGVPQKILKLNANKLNPTQSTKQNNNRKSHISNDELTPLCSVCEEIPRIQTTNFKVIQCENGHIICQHCRPEIETCPICRATQIDNRNLFVEDFIKTKLENKPYKCRHYPCKVTMKMMEGKLAGHEHYCIFREADCANKQCTWHGNLKNLIEHVQKQKCTYINLEDKVDRQKRTNLPIGVEGPYTFKFKNVLMFPNHNPEIFSQINMDMSFKPILLVATGITNFCCYLQIYRNAAGIWNFKIYSKLRPQDATNIKATIIIGNNEINYSHTTTVLSSQEKQYHASQLGNFMKLNDCQVKRLNNGTKIFDFEVIIKPDPTFSRDSHTKANMGTLYISPNETNPP